MFVDPPDTTAEQLAETLADRLLAMYGVRVVPKVDPEQRNVNRKFETRMRRRIEVTAPEIDWRVVSIEEASAISGASVQYIRCLLSPCNRGRAAKGYHWQRPTQKRSEA